MAIWKWRGTIPFGFNTAGGMDCMQFGRSTHFRCPRHVSIPQAVWIACNNAGEGGYVPSTEVSIPQAVWIACNYYEKGICIVPMLSFQYRKRYGLHAMMDRWLQRRDSLGFNTASGMDCMQFYAAISKAFYAVQFQYRKRYGLHAIPSLTALGTAEPRSGFSKRSALFGKSPQPRGIFLSPKSAESVRKPCNIKETFVHGKNLKLMAFSPKSLPSL